MEVEAFVDGHHHHDDDHDDDHGHHEPTPPVALRTAASPVRSSCSLASLAVLPTAPLTRRSS
jgi:hypothetical protein